MKDPEVEQLLAQARKDIEQARKNFRADIRAILKAAYDDGEAISGAIGTISVDDAYEAWAKKLMDTLIARSTWE